MINVNAVVESQNKKLFDRLVESIDKRILELDENTFEFSFYIHSNVPCSVAEMLKSVYRQQGWSISGGPHGTIWFRILNLKADVFSQLDASSRLRRVSALKTKTVQSGDDLLSRNVVEDHVSVTFPSFSEESVSNLHLELYKFETELFRKYLVESNSKKYYTYAPTFHMAMTDIRKALPTPTTMIMSNWLYYYLFDEQKIHPVQDALFVQNAVAGLRGSVFGMDLYTIADENMNDILNDIFIFDSANYPLPLEIEQTITESEECYSADLSLVLGETKFVQLCVYR